TDEGARVGIVDRDAERLQAVAEEIRGNRGSVHAVAADVSEEGAPQRAIDEIREALGPVDALVNNAGISTHIPIGDDGFDEALARTLQINLVAYTRFVRAALADLKRDRQGRIVNVASTEALGATPGLSPYTISKHGVVGLTRALAAELGPDGVTVNCICPGPINTAMTAVIPDEHKQRYARRRTVLHRY